MEAAKKKGGKSPGRGRGAQKGRPGDGANPGRAGQRPKTFRESVRAVLACQVPDEGLRARLEELGMDATMLNAIHAAVHEKAMKGDVSAARYLRDMAEESDGEGDAEARPLEFLDLSRLTDEELRQIAWDGNARARGNGEREA